MKSNFDLALKKVLAHEGGWADHPKDPGGATMKGVTLYNYRRYVKKNATKRDLRNISDKEIAYVYRKFYWDKVRGDNLPSGLDYAVFDFAVNSGPSRAAKFLQRILPTTVDGRIGPNTILEAKKYGAAPAINLLCNNRLSWLKTLRHWGTFGKGWSRRVSGVRKDALRMVDSKPLIVPVNVTPDPAPTRKSLLDVLILLLTKLLSKG